MPEPRVTIPPSISVEAPDVTADLAPINWALRLVQLRLQLASGAVAAAGVVAHPSAGSDQMTAARRSEFEGGRLAAATALREAGCSGSCDLAADPRGVPLFPEGFVGSIAHKHGRAIAVVAMAGSTRGVGLDLEFDEGLHERALASEVVTGTEEAQLALLRTAHPALVSAATLLLAAKESLFKAVFPIGRTEFDFDDAELTFDATTRSFWAARFPGDETIAVRGAYEIHARWIVAAAVATQQRPSRPFDNRT